MRAFAITEAVVAIALILPILFLLVLVTIAVSHYFLLKQELSSVARQAAHEIATAYGNLDYTTMNSGGSFSGPANIGDANYLNIVNKIAVPGILKINSSPQFQVYFNIPNGPSLDQSYVTAKVVYRSGPGLPVFPWNPLSTGFLRFETTGITVQSTGSWPIPHS
jgi:Flp pilus assembly protein TadG